MADPKKMTVEEMLAAARAEKSGGGEPAPKSAPAEKPAPAAEESTAATPEKKPAAKPAAAKPAGAKPGAMSVADMLAAARAEKSGGAKPAAEAKPKAEPKKEAKPAAKGDPAKASPKAPAAEKAGAAKDTASVLADVRKAAKPGPMTKAEAAAKGIEPVSEKRKSAVPPMPAKPAYARTPPPAPADEEQDRRGFLNTMMGALIGTPLAVGFSSLAITHLLWVLGFARFMFPNILTEPPTRFRVGFPDEYAPGQVQEKYKAQFGVWIVRHEYEGLAEIYALKSVCTHLGCTPNWLEGEQKFKCPCHGSGFYKDGINFEGPAPRPLERYAIRKADDGQIEVDKSRTFFEEKGEWKDPASFVTV